MILHVALLITILLLLLLCILKCHGNNRLYHPKGDLYDARKSLSSDSLSRWQCDPRQISVLSKLECCFGEIESDYCVILSNHTHDNNKLAFDWNNFQFISTGSGESHSLLQSALLYPVMGGNLSYIREEILRDYKKIRLERNYDPEFLSGLFPFKYINDLLSLAIKSLTKSYLYFYLNMVIIIIISLLTLSLHCSKQCR